MAHQTGHPQVTGQPQSIHQLVRQLQIISAAMVGGVVTFTAVSMLIGQSTSKQPDLASMLLPALGLLAVGQFGAWMALRQVMARNLQNALASCPPEERWARLSGHLRVAHLIPAAMAEGTGLFGVVIYLITGATAALIAPGVAAALLMRMFPTRDRLEQAIARLEQ